MYRTMIQLGHPLWVAVSRGTGSNISLFSCQIYCEYEKKETSPLLKSDSVGPNAPICPMILTPRVVLFATHNVYLKNQATMTVCAHN